MNIFIKCNSGRTLAVDLDPKWDIKNVKNVIAPKLGMNPEDVKIIFAGRELLDSTIIEDCDLGQLSMLHAVNLKDDRTHSLKQKGKLIGENIPDVGEIPVLQEKSDRTKAQFYVYCNVCEDLRIGKLRVRCSSCKSGAIIVDTDPKSWTDVLKLKRISGNCEQDGCPDGVFGWAEFYFRCSEHVPQSQDDQAVPLHLIKNNFRKIPCLACTEIEDIVFVFGCKEGHVTCIMCFRSYAVLRLRERQFVMDDTLGYTISCPAGCPDSLIDESHHFKLLTKDQYEMYQRFATEECVLKAGGVLCPQPGCGDGIIPDNSCNKVACLNGCGYVFCRNCLQGYHLGECTTVNNTVPADDIQHITDPARASQARWDEASNVAIRVMTKPCPKCRTATERSGGCMHMICTRCSFHWCWVCQTEWSRDCMGTHWFG